MTELRFDAEIHASAELVFCLLAELRDYDRWLPKSLSFRGTTTISEGPIGAGTTYVEPGPLGTRRGKITDFEPPTRLNFEQPMTMKPRMLGVLDIRLFHTLTPRSDGVSVLRVVQITPAGLVRFVVPMVVGSFRAENERMLRYLKAFAERQALG